MLCTQHQEEINRKHCTGSQPRFWARTLLYCDVTQSRQDKQGAIHENIRV